MKRILFLLLFVLLLSTFSNAQTTEEQLRNYVSFFASKELRGREPQSTEAERTLQYIKTELGKENLVCKDFFLDADSLKREGYEDYKGKYHALYTVIESNSSNKIDEYLVITTTYSGFGVDTIQGYEIIKYSATSSASSTAITMELAKNLNKEAKNLKRGIIVIFAEGEYNIPFANYLNKDYNIVAGFDIDRLGYQAKDSLGNYNEEAYNIEYNLSSRIRNASKLVNMLVLNDLDINARIYSYSHKNTKIPFSFISNNNYIDIYQDVADSVDYFMMNKLSTQIQRVITNIDNADLEIDKYKASVNKQESIWSSFANKYEHKSYFGVNIMPFGTNRHEYQEGNMTGKSARAFSVGVFYRWQFSSTWALKLDANYERLKAKRHEGKYSANVLSVPLSLVLTTGGNAMWGLDVYAGAYYDYIIRGKLNGEKISFDDFKREEWGFQWGLDVRVYRFIIGLYAKTPWNSTNTKTYRENNNLGRINEYTQYTFKLGW
ncbi:MAG: outer membrane beta-barrel protein, partial [Bacteroidota bacterium]|nr:outer membrane beta-barrel protein [Bacteroidota bacterium]